MADDNKPAIGSISWFDLTVEDAQQLRDFYQSVVGWTSSSVEMDGYDDFCMVAAESENPVAGVCHARGSNADLPPQWLIYITVADLSTSVERCVELGGTVVAPPRSLGGGSFAVIQDPAGAVAALYQAPAD